MYFWTFLSSDIKRNKTYGQFEDSYRGTRGKQNKTKHLQKNKRSFMFVCWKRSCWSPSTDRKMVDRETNTLEIKIIFFLEIKGNIHLLLAGLEKVLGVCSFSHKKQTKLKSVV